MRISMKAARVNANLSQEEASKKLGVATATLRNWEKGKSYPKMPEIEKICDLYSVTYDDIFFA